MTDPSGKVAVRRLRKEDIGNGLLETLSVLFPVGITTEEAGKFYDTIEGNPAYRIFVAEADGRIVGAATLLIEQKFLLKGAKFGYLEDMAVRKEYQGKGIGQRLVQAALQEAEQAGCLNVRLDCNDETAPFYEKSGFRRKDEVNRMQKNLRFVQFD